MGKSTCEDRGGSCNSQQQLAKGVTNSLAALKQHFLNRNVSLCSQQQMQVEVSSSIQTTGEIAARLRLLRTCLDLDAIELKTRVTLVDSDGAPSLTELLRASTCVSQDEDVVLQSAVYNCSRLDGCEHTCSGPSREVSGTMSRLGDRGTDVAIAH